MLKDMMNKKMMGKMQEQMEVVKEKLNKISVIGEADNGNLKAVANGNRMLNSVTIDDEFYKTASKAQLEELIVTSVNRALEQAERVEKTEMSHSMMGMLPGMG